MIRTASPKSIPRILYCIALMAALTLTLVIAASVTCGSFNFFDMLSFSILLLLFTIYPFILRFIERTARTIKSLYTSALLLMRAAASAKPSGLFPILL